jgi:hypothetical protein
VLAGLQVDYVVCVPALSERHSNLRSATKVDAPANTFMPVDEEMRTFVHEGRRALEAGPFTVQSYRGTVSGYSATCLKICFEPVGLGEREVDVSIILTAAEHPHLSLAPLAVHLQVRSACAPLSQRLYTVVGRMSTNAFLCWLPHLETCHNFGQYLTCRLPGFLWHPQAPGRFQPALRQPGSVQISSTEGSHMQATCNDVPVTVDRNILDLHCCLLRATYHNHIVVRNTGTTTAKASVSVPAPLNSLLSVTPSFGFVQASGEFLFTLTLCASPEAMLRCQRYISDSASNSLSLPLRVNVAGQRHPISVTVRVQLTTSDLLIEPSDVAFGRCTVGETTAVRLQLHNAGSLPASFGIMALPHTVSVGPRDGFGTIPAKASVKRLLMFTPEFPGDHQFTVTCRTIAGRTFPLRCTAFAECLPLTLSHKRLELSATALGDYTRVSTMLRNTGGAEQCFEFAVPEASGLTVTPRCSTVPAHAAVRVQVDFRPRPPHQDGTSAGAGGVDTSIGPADACLSLMCDGSRPRRCESWCIPCFIQGTLRDGSGGGDGGLPAAIHLNVDTATVRPYITLDGLPFDWGKGQYVHSFGPLSVGATTSVSISVVNCTDGDTHESLPLAVDLDPLGAFEQVNAARPVPANGSMAVILQFKPTHSGEFWEVTTFHVPGQKIELQLSGVGIVPRVMLQPEGAPRTLDLGDVSVGDEAAQTFELYNPCPFSLEFECRLRGLSHRNMGSVPVLFTKPGGALIGAGAFTAVTVCFQPDCQVRWCDL